MNRLRRLTWCALLLAALAGGTALLAAETATSPGGLEKRIDAYVAPYVRSNNFSGAILIAKGGRVLLRKGYGMANQEASVANTPGTKFHVASVSKAFTAAAILLLEQRGKLSVADPLRKFIPDYPEGDKITIHHLLTHTSGIPNVNNFPDYGEKSRTPHSLEEIIGWFKNKPLEFPPGARYSYSNSNYNLLAYVIEKTSGQSYGEFLRENIFVPLEMNDTAHDGDASLIVSRRASGYMPAGATGLENAPYLDWSIKTGNGSLYTTVDDLYKWDRALYGDKLFTPATRQKMFTEHVEGMGYGWFIRTGKRRSVASNGRAPGFSASLDRFVEDDVCVIVVSNLYSSITQSMAPDLAAMVFGEMRKPLIPAQPVVISQAVLNSYVGRYQFGEDFVFNRSMVGEVKKMGAGLVLISGDGGGTSYLIPQSEDSFLDRLYGGIVTFTKNEKGKVTQLNWNFGRNYKANKLD